MRVLATSPVFAGIGFAGIGWLVWLLLEQLIDRFSKARPLLFPRAIRFSACFVARAASCTRPLLKI
jgi:hypothetical protein